MVRRPSRLAVRATRQAISPRLAIRTDLNIDRPDPRTLLYYPSAGPEVSPDGSAAVLAALARCPRPAAPQLVHRSPPSAAAARHSLCSLAGSRRREGNHIWRGRGKWRGGGGARAARG